jgi:hypothetical protein
MVMERKYGLLLVILPFIWLNQPGLNRISDQNNMLVMTLPPNHQSQTEKYLTGTKTSGGIACHRESGAVVALIRVIWVTGVLKSDPRPTWVERFQHKWLEEGSVKTQVVDDQILDFG